MVIYGDFNCPFSALASSRAGDLERRGAVEVDWRSVEHDASIPPLGELISGDRRDELERELGQIRDLLAIGEPDRLRLPAKRANTRLATKTYAAASHQDRLARRELFFAAYWVDGLDLTDRQVVESLGGPRRNGGTAQRWRSGWMALPQPIVPAMVLSDGSILGGLAALEHLSRLACGTVENRAG
jgi:hypothetical protein